jgi:hypothetical protein
MTRPVTTKNALLSGLTFTDVSVHSAYPGTTGANEIASSVRAAIVVNAASGGSRALNAAANVSVPASTVRWLGFWNGSTFVESAPNGGFTPRNFMSIASSDLIYSEAHGYSDTNQIVFFNGNPPAPLVEGTIYFVRDATTDTFKVAATSGGAAIDLTAATSFGCIVCRITEDVYASSGTHTLSTATFVVPD